MIITCDQCLKKFEIDSKLIPDEGRLLQCSSCHNKWFYKKDIPQKTIVISKPPKIQDDESEKIINEIIEMIRTKMTFKKLIFLFSN